MFQFKKILIGIAFSPTLRENIHEASRLSNMFNAQLYFVHVGEKSLEKESKIKTILEEVSVPTKNTTLLFQEGNPVDAILEVANNNNIDLIILGALQKEKFFTYYIGSIARKLTRKSPCSVLLMIKSSIARTPCKHIVVNGLEDPSTKETIETAFYVSNALGNKKITIVEEIKQNEIHVKADDDESLKQVNLEKERLKEREESRIQSILENIDPKYKDNHLTIRTQSIFGRKGYSIGHYARVVRADLLIMNAQKKASIWDRIFTHDLEYILSDLPTNTLIVK